MVTKKTIKDKKVIVQQRELVDPKTGETIPVNQIIEREKDANFNKIWLTHILDAIDKVTTKKFNVMKYFIENKNNKNLIIANQTEIAEDVGVSIQTVSSSIKILKEEDFLSMVKPGVYRVNASHIFKGSHNQRMDVLRTYYKEKSPPEGQTTIEDHQKEE